MAKLDQGAEPERLPPHDKRVEQALLGAILRNPQALGSVPAWFKAKFFYVFAHRKIFEAIEALAGQGGEVSAVTVANRLSELGQAEDVGGYGYFVELHENSLSQANLAPTARIIAKHFVRRQLMWKLNELLGRLFDWDLPLVELVREEKKFERYAGRLLRAVINHDQVLSEQFFKEKSDGSADLARQRGSGCQEVQSGNQLTSNGSKQDKGWSGID